ncbi:hypothetical protein HDU76_008813 [Blyttiomyces sp. JEL0837]|nr:hypothetical protein HDU76_008813 [Blyttiomyces sp. JEL0837]
MPMPTKGKTLISGPPRSTSLSVPPMVSVNSSSSNSDVMGSGTTLIDYSSTMEEFGVKVSNTGSGKKVVVGSRIGGNAVVADGGYGYSKLNYDIEQRGVGGEGRGGVMIWEVQLSSGSQRNVDSSDALRSVALQVNLYVLIPFICQVMASVNELLGPLGGDAIPLVQVTMSSLVGAFTFILVSFDPAVQKVFD